MKYREECEVTRSNKELYVKGLQNIISQRKIECEKLRSEYAENIISEQEKFRKEFKEMLGWPLVGYENSSLPAVEFEELSEEDGYTIYRAKFEILDGLVMSGLFFKSHNMNKRPLVIVSHGGLGTPERISGVYGTTTNYNDMLQRVRKHDVHVFAPQLLLWSDEYDVKFDRVKIDASLKRVGSSITAVEIFAISKILDYFENQNYVSTFGMVGLSYGGFYTLYTTAVDTRIKSAISCAFFNKRDLVDWPDWTWDKSALKFDDAEIACLIYPRKLCIEIANRDELFNYKQGIESFEKVKSLCHDVGTDWVELVVFDGVHEFCNDDEPIEKLICDLT